MLHIPANLGLIHVIIKYKDTKGEITEHLRPGFSKTLVLGFKNTELG